MATQPKLFALNIILLISLLLQIAIGARLFLITQGLISESTATWINLHIINGLILVLLIAIHLYMNRRWIALQLKGPRVKKKTSKTKRAKKSTWLRRKQ